LISIVIRKWSGDFISRWQYRVYGYSEFRLSGGQTGEWAFVQETPMGPNVFNWAILYNGLN